MFVSLLLATTLLTPAISSRKPAVEPQISIVVDSARGEVVITAGPYDLPNMPPDMAEMHMGSPQVLRFDWPVDGGLRGFNLSMQTEDGKPLPKSVIHHLIAVNFDRRQIVYQMVERLFGWGKETDPVLLPAGVGVPLAKGQHLGVYAMWHNDSGHDIHNAYLKMTLAWIPKSRLQNPVLPMYVDVNNHIGGVTTFDVPPGKSTQAYEFEFPLSGRLIGIGGHLHDFGVAVRFEDAVTGKVLVRLKSDRDQNGEISKVGRFIWGFHEEALPIEAHHLLSRRRRIRQSNRQEHSRGRNGTHQRRVQPQRHVGVAGARSGERGHQARYRNAPDVQRDECIAPIEVSRCAFDSRTRWT